MNEFPVGVYLPSVRSQYWNVSCAWFKIHALAKQITEFASDASQRHVTREELHSLMQSAECLNFSIHSVSAQFHIEPLEDVLDSVPKITFDFLAPVAEALYQESHPHECFSCHTTHSSQWRRGPRGPNSLCNACGLRYWRKRKKISKEKATGKLSDIYTLLNP